MSAWPDRPGPGWVYPQTGQGILLPMEYPYTKMEFISAGGSRKDNATQFTPASDVAWKINVSAVECSETGGLCDRAGLPLWLAVHRAGAALTANAPASEPTWSPMPLRPSSCVQLANPAAQWEDVGRMPQERVM